MPCPKREVSRVPSGLPTQIVAAGERRQEAKLTGLAADFATRGRSFIVTLSTYLKGCLCLTLILVLSRRGKLAGRVPCTASVHGPARVVA